MSENRFDDLSRQLATATSRRGMLKVLLAGVAGLAGGWLSRGSGLRRTAVQDERGLPVLPGMPLWGMLPYQGHQLRRQLLCCI